MLMENKQAGSIEHDGFTFGYSIEGDGPTILVIGNAIINARAFSQNLRLHVRLVFVDHRFFAKTSHQISEEHLELEKVVDDIELLRKKLNLGNVILLGYESSVAIAVEYAKKYASVVNRLILVSPKHSFGEEYNHRVVHTYLNSPKNAQRMSELREMVDIIQSLEKESDETNDASNPQDASFRLKGEEKREFIEDTKLFVYNSLRFYDPDFDYDFLHENVETLPELQNSVLSNLVLEYDLVDHLEEISQPILIIAGAHDYHNVPDLWNTFRPGNNLSVRLFKKSGCLPHVEEAAKFDTVLLKWINRSNCVEKVK